VLASLREKALQSAADRTSTLGIFEWSAPDGCDSNDPAAWAAANPALGHRMTAQAVLSALETDPEDVFRTKVPVPVGDHAGRGGRPGRVAVAGRPGCRVR
jgi:hypothetical protein